MGWCARILLGRNERKSAYDLHLVGKKTAYHLEIPGCFAALRRQARSRKGQRKPNYCAGFGVLNALK